MKTNISITLSSEDKQTAIRAAKRNVELELNLRQPSHKVHKNKKAYNRNPKHKNQIFN